jgi:hypothetical protein
MRSLSSAAMIAIALAVSACAGGHAVSRYSLRAGQTRSFVHAQPGDSVVCVGRGDSIRLEVPAPGAGANDYKLGFDRKLSLTLAPLNPLSPSPHSGTTARCKAR